MTVTTALKDIVRPLRSQARLKFSLIKLRTQPPTGAQLELGSGPVRKPGWITVDMCGGVDVYWDLRVRLPFADASFERVYCSHVLEHFSYPDLRKLLKDVLRVLRPGGQFSIAVPDGALYVDAYLGKIPSANLLKYTPAVVSDQRMDVLNYIFYMDSQHRIMFDKDSLAHHCREAGFVDCKVRAFDPSVDSAARQYESLYMACTKSITN